MKKSDQESKNKKNQLLNLRNFNHLLLGMIIVCGVYYIVGTNELSIKGFELQELKENKQQILKENELNELSTMQLSSYNNINERVKALDMVAVGEVKYISGDSVVVAKK